MNLSIDLTELTPSDDRMDAIVSRFQTDREALGRLFTAPWSPRRRERFHAFYGEWQAALNALLFDALTRNDRLDWLLLHNLLAAERLLLDREAAQFAEMEPLIPFALSLIALEDSRRQRQDILPEAVAEPLHQALTALQETRRALEAEEREDAPKPTVANRAARATDQIRLALGNWFDYFHAFDPLFTWWTEKPYRALETALSEYADFLRRKLAHAEDADTIIGDPIGRDALNAELDRALIPYTPEELIAIADKEREWCLQEAKRAAQEMGLGDDWRAAIDRVKTLHVAPGEQPRLVRELAEEAIAYLEANDLVTIPPLARECWRMEMMSPDMQKVNPFFLGGEEIIISFPTSDMEHAQKRMSLRGNNRHFSRATVQHELIPGHHLQMFSQERYRPYRQIFYTPFWIEGWTLHWEMLLWDLGFAQSPEDRLGMLFWRLHRCARVLFSLRFHLGEMTPMECVEMLVNEVGHERDNALAEVRRSFGGDYDPLYQCAYLLGGLQVRELHRELVGSGRMTHRAFHDAFLRQNVMPIALLRALLTDAPLEINTKPQWRFYPL